MVKLHTAKKEVWDVKQTQWRQKQQKEFAKHFDKSEEKTEEEKGLNGDSEQEKKINEGKESEMLVDEEKKFEKETIRQ